MRIVPVSFLETNGKFPTLRAINIFKSCISRQVFAMMRSAEEDVMGKFVQETCPSPEPAFVLASDRQLDDLIRFCTVGTARFTGIWNRWGKGTSYAFSHEFRYSIYLTCFIHFRKNIKRKLQELQYPDSVIKGVFLVIFLAVRKEILKALLIATATKSLIRNCVC